MCVCVRVCLSMTQLVREVEALVRYVYGVEALPRTAGWRLVWRLLAP